MAIIKRERFRGPLQGIPFGAKDLLSVKDVPTTWGAKPYAAQVFDYTATVLDKLEKTGAILIGKLAMVELAGGGGYRIAGASMFGPGLNPWNKEHWSGGSSSGSGSAVAAGLVTFRYRLGNIRFYPDAFGVLRRYRTAPDIRLSEPLWSDGAFLDAR